MERDIQIAGASANDLPAIKQLLEDNNLPTAGVDDHWKTFVVAREGDTLVACGGSEAYELAALIRSVALVWLSDVSWPEVSLRLLSAMLLRSILSLTGMVARGSDSSARS